MQKLAIHTPDWIPQSLRHGSPLGPETYRSNAAQSLLEPKSESTEVTEDALTFGADDHPRRSRSRSLESLSLSSAGEEGDNECNNRSKRRKLFERSSPSKQSSRYQGDATSSGDDNMGDFDSGGESDPEYRSKMRKRSVSKSSSKARSAHSAVAQLLIPTRAFLAFFVLCSMNGKSHTCPSECERLVAYVDF